MIFAKSASHHDFSRYEKVEIEKFRTRNIDDIRERQRETAELLRGLHKHYKMFQNRRILDYMHQETEDSQVAQESSAYDSNSFSEISPSTNYYSPCDTPDSVSTDFLNPPQSCSSISTRSNASTPQPDLYPSLTSLVEGRLDRLIASVSSRITNNSQQTTCLRGRNTSRSIPKHLNDSPSVDEAKIQSNLEAFNQLLSSCQDQAQRQQSFLHNWRIILESLESYESPIIRHVIHLIASHTLQQDVLPETLLNLLQHGLMFNLRSAIWKSDDALPMVLNLLLVIVQSVPALAPYLTELLAHSRILGEFQKRLALYNLQEIQSIVDFFFHLTTLFMTQITSESAPPQPLIPQILRVTGPSDKTRLFYSPIASLGRILDPAIVKQITTTCLSRTFRQENYMIEKALLILANSLKLAQIRSMSGATNEDINWIVKLLCAIQDAHVEQTIKSQCASLDRCARSAEFSEHGSQGIQDLGALSRMSNQCQQFLEFYSQTFGNLSSVYSHLMAQEHDALSSSQSSEDDGW